MIKAIRKLLCYIITFSLVAGGGFLFISVTKGGDWFRSFGKTVKQKSKDAGETADKIKSIADDAKDTTKKQGERIKSIATDAADKVSDKADDASKTIKGVRPESAGKTNKSGTPLGNISGD